MYTNVSVVCAYDRSVFVDMGLACISFWRNNSSTEPTTTQLTFQLDSVCVACNSRIDTRTAVSSPESRHFGKIQISIAGHGVRCAVSHPSTPHFSQFAVVVDVVAVLSIGMNSSHQMCLQFFSLALVSIALASRRRSRCSQLLVFIHYPIEAIFAEFVTETKEQKKNQHHQHITEGNAA